MEAPKAPTDLITALQSLLTVVVRVPMAHPVTTLMESPATRASRLMAAVQWTTRTVTIHLTEDRNLIVRLTMSPMAVLLTLLLPMAVPALTEAQKILTEALLTHLNLPTAARLAMVTTRAIITNTITIPTRTFEFFLITQRPTLYNYEMTTFLFFE